MADRAVVVLCADQNEINHAVNEWVNVKGYSHVHTSSADHSAAHFVDDGAGGYTRSGCSPRTAKHIVVFES